MLNQNIDPLLTNLKNLQDAPPEGNEIDNSIPAGMQTRMAIEKIALETAIDKEQAKSEAIHECLKTIGNELKRLASLITKNDGN